MKLKKTFLDYCYSGVQDSKNTELIRRVFLVNIFGLVGIAMTTPLGLLALYHGSYSLSGVLLLLSFLYLLNHFLLKKTLNCDLVSSICSIPLGLLFVYLTHTGGVNNTGPFWLYIFPAVALFLHGFKKGLIYIFTFLSIVVFVFYFPDLIQSPALYNQEYKLRLILSFLVVTFLSACYEYSRMHAFNKMHVLRKELELAAKIDPLTNLYNRRGIFEKIEYEYIRSKRSETKFTIIICDIDYFKKINDEYGHDCGDYVLSELSKLFKNLTREQDSIARWGGEEFLLLLPETGLPGAYVVGEKIRKSVQHAIIKYDNIEISITLSFGLVEVDSDHDIDISIKQADEYLYQAKIQGRNMVLPVG